MGWPYAVVCAKTEFVLICASPDIMSGFRSSGLRGWLARGRGPRNAARCALEGGWE